MSTYSTKYTVTSRGRQRTYQADPQPFKTCSKKPDGASKWISTDYPYYNLSPIQIPPPTPIYGGVITRVAKKNKVFYFYEAYLIFIYGALTPQPNVYNQFIFSEYEGSILVAGIAYDGNASNIIRVDPDPTTIVLYKIYDLLYEFISEYEYFETYQTSQVQIDIEPPTYLSLLDGYGLDARGKNNTILGLIPDKSFNFRYQFYRQNRLEQLPLKSIDWITKEIDVLTGIAFEIDITDIVLGTFFCNDPYIENQILAINTPNYYPLKYLFELFLDELFTYWKSLVVNSPLPQIDLSDSRSSYTTTTIVDTKALTIAADNNAWLLGAFNVPNGNYSSSDPFFVYDQVLSNQRHFNIQPDNSLGAIVADSQRTIDLLTIANQNKTALAALKITLDAVKTKVDTLTPTNTSTLATSASIIDIKAELDALEVSINLLKVEVL